MDRFAHQEQSIAFVRRNHRVFDASDPGTGKSRVVVETFSERRLRGGGAALIVAPKTILRSVWRAEFKKFAPHLVVSIASAGKRDEAFEAQADVYLINHDGISWVARQYKKDKMFLRHFDTLVVDESGAFKHATSLRSKALRSIAKHFTYRGLLNGTPNPNSVLELWHQMFLLDDGQRLGESFFAYRTAVCTPKQVGPSANMVKWTDRVGAAEAVAKLVEDVTIRHRFEDCVDIPENHRYVIPYYLTEEQLRVYTQMKKEQMLELRSKEFITAQTAAVVATKLLQIASGAVYDEQGKWHLIDRDRYELVMDLVEARKHSVVFFLWQHQKECLLEEAKKRGITYGVLDGTITSDREREETVTYFQNGLYRIILAHPQSAAHGLTLTRGTSTIWASPTYNLEHFLQGLKRIHRAGQTEKTETITLVAQNTLEMHVMNLLEGKRLNMENLLALLELE
jgi:SNF2 family DNA or RNA helicase